MIDQNNDEILKRLDLLFPYTGKPYKKRIVDDDVFYSGDDTLAKIANEMSNSHDIYTLDNNKIGEIIYSFTVEGLIFIIPVIFKGVYKEVWTYNDNLFSGFLFFLQVGLFEEHEHFDEMLQLKINGFIDSLNPDQAKVIADCIEDMITNGEFFECDNEVLQKFKLRLNS